MSNNFSYKDLEPAIREKLASGGRVRIMPNGTSMLPMIRQGLDEVELTATNGRLKKYDIAFYKRGSGQFVLHRIIKVRKNDYVFCGDNQTDPEYGITDDMIIAVVSGYYKDGKYIDIHDKQYLKYCKSHVKKQRMKYYIPRLKLAIKKLLKMK